MRKRKFSGILAALAVVLCLAFAFPSPADVGNSFSGGGGSSGGSSSGGSSGGGYSGGSSWGGGYSSGRVYVSGGGSLDMGPEIVFLFIIVVGVIVAMSYKGVISQASQAPGTGVPVSGGEVPEEELVARIREEDPDFSPENFKSYAKEAWLALQEAWEAKEWQKVRPFESNSLFNIHSRQLQEYIDQHKTNHMDMQNVRSVRIGRYRKDENQEILTVKLDASLLDYVTDDETGEILEGSKTEYVHRSYGLEFIRKRGVKTKGEEGIAVTNCPNCGAPTEITGSGQCEYCKSVITNGDYGWVMNQYGPWQW